MCDSCSLHKPSRGSRVGQWDVALALAPRLGAKAPPLRIRVGWGLFLALYRETHLATEFWLHVEVTTYLASWGYWVLYRDLLAAPC